MNRRRILLLGLDGFDVDLAERFVREGLLRVSGDIPTGHHGLAGSFDVVPTIIELLGKPALPRVSGRFLLPQFAPVCAGTEREERT